MKLKFAAKPGSEGEFAPISVFSPLRLFLYLLFVIFSLEVGIMFALEMLPAMVKPVMVNFLDSILLTTLSAPLLWKLIVKPLRTIAMAEMSKAKMVMDHVVDGMIIFGESEAIKSVNTAAEEMFGFPSTELLQEPITFLLPDIFTHSGSSFAFELLVDGEKKRDSKDIDGRRKDNSIFPADVSISKVTLDGKVMRIAIIRDITKQKEAKRRLYETNQSLQAIIQASPLAIVAVTPEGNISMWNKSAEATFGWKEQEVIGRQNPLIPPALATEHLKLREQVLKGNGFGYRENCRLKKDGSLIEVGISTAPIYSAENEIIGIMSIIADISERMKTQKELLLLKRAIESSNNGIFIADTSYTDTPIVYVNPAFEHMTGYSKSEIIGKSPSFIRFDSRDKLEIEKLYTAFKEKKEGSFCLRTYRKDGSRLWNELFVSPVKESNGAITNYIGVMNDITERKYHDKQLAYLANHDTLTDLPNRNLFHDRLKQAIAFHDRGNKYAAVLFIDLDHFKIVNDTFGHQKGDLLLLAVTNRLDSCIRKSDTLARFGGDKFCILLGNLSKNEDVVPVINKISNAFIPVFKFNDVEIFITASIGISIFPADGDDPDQLLKNAETAMYHAKGEGRNTYQFFSSEMNNRVFERLSLETSLHKALEKTEFLLHYQPTVDVATNRIVGMEALVRWNHPEMGLVPPGRFISHAEESGLIVPIGEWVLKTACKQNKEWQEKGCPPLRVAVNLSARQFKQKNLVQMVARVLEETQLEPRWLELEITESVVMQNPEETIKILEELKQMGIELAIDDFGTGYSSLSYLKRFPLKILKIDQSFVRDVTNDEDDATIVKAIIAMAHGLGMKVIAEGVETAEQLAFLATYNCEEIQGYYFSKPLSADMFEKLIR